MGQMGRTQAEEARYQTEVACGTGYLRAWYRRKDGHIRCLILACLFFSLFLSSITYSVPAFLVSDVNVCEWVHLKAVVGAG